jgi:hypothetical protein
MPNDQFWAEIGKFIAASGGVVVIAFGIFSWLGKRWIENQFNQRLEAYKAAQAQELEEYKAKVTTLFSRITKIHEKEFDVLPTAWCKLQTALGKVGIPAAIFKEYPDLKFLNDGEVEELLARHSFSTTEKQKLMLADPLDRNQLYQDSLFWEELNRAYDALNDFHNYIVFNKIFLSSDLFDTFNTIDKAQIDVINNLRYGKEVRDHKMTHKAMQDFRAINAQLENLEKLVQKRLHYQDALEV